MDNHPTVDSTLDNTTTNNNQSTSDNPELVPEDSTEPSNATSPQDENTILPGYSEEVHAMAKFAFRLFDSYQKKGIVTRDTVHRFLTDVHGEDSYKKPPVKALLDTMFESDTKRPSSNGIVPSTATTGQLQASLSEPQFVKKIQETFNPNRPSHLLLDWMSILFCSFIPLDELPPSVAAYLDTMEHRPRPLCDLYGIAESRLFEVKRRFHSLVRSASNNGLIQGDLIGSTTTTTTGASSTEDEAPDSFIEAAASTTTTPPKHSIPVETFIESVSASNDEQGNGGFLPESLARLVFAAGCRNDNATNYADGLSGNYWGLTHVLQFGCTAVRHNRMQPEHPDQPLLRFLFSMFQLAAPAGDLEDTRVLNEAQVEAMILLAVEHAEYRLNRDSPPTLDFTESSVKGNVKENNSHEEENERTVDIEACSLLGLLPQNLESRRVWKMSRIPLKQIVEEAMKVAEDGVGMTFDEFCRWNNEGGGSGPATRLGPLMVDLRLVASVLFGVPPTLASMEVGLIAEIERRHKARYPQTSVSRRGPRGTVWYIIDALWLKDWKQLTDEVSKTEEDSDDHRNTVKGPIRGLPRIDNSNLLSPNGVLALRNDVRWKHDYEIIPPLGWQALQAWYDGGPPIHRSVVRFVGASSPASKRVSPHSAKAQIPTENEIELHPLFVTIYMCDAASRGEARPFQQNYQLSRVNPMGVMLKQMCRELDVDPDLARLWVMDTGPNYSPREEDKPSEWLLALDKNIVDQRKERGLQTNPSKSISLLLELKDAEKGLWPRGEDGKGWNFPKEETDVAPSTDLGDGIVGLYNMGYVGR
jgi:hypothetical protein